MRRRPLYLVLIIVGIIILAVALIGFIREYVAPWLLQIIWRAYLMGDSIPQVMIWAVFVAAIPVLAIFVLIQGRAKLIDDGTSTEQIQSGQVLGWSKLIQRSGNGDYFRRRFIRALADLTIVTLRYRERMTEDEAKQALRSGQSQIAPGIYDYLAQGWRREYFSAADKKHRSGWLAGLRLRGASERMGAQWKDERLTQVLDFLETELEVKSGS